MAPFIHGSPANSADGRLVHLDSSDDEGFVEMGASYEAESSYRAENSNYETRLPDNGLLNKIQEKMPEIDEMIAKLMVIFPQLSPDQALYQLLKGEGQLPHEMLLHSAIEHFLQHGVPDTDVPVENGRREIDLDGAGTSYTVQEQDNIEILGSEPASEIYEECSLYRLGEDFPLVRMSDIRQAFKIHNWKFTHTYKAIEQVCRELQDSGKHKLKAKRDSGTDTDILKRNWIPKNGLTLMRSPRSKRTKLPITCPVFEKEWDCLKKESSGKLQTDLLIHSKNASEAESTNDACTSVVEDIECGCCCMEFSFEKMVQCADGHLFCFQCLLKHVEESTFGSFQARSSLPCMDTSGCTESIPMSEVRRTLPVDVIERYEQRQAQVDVEQAKLDGLVYCPFCNFPCEVDKDVRVLECPNSKCLKASCIECKESSHIPLRCEEVEKKSETALRRRIEEIMSKAVIRVCNSCKAELVKTDGCNKVTCRCGTTMCYVCRQTISREYSHFCQHAREPGRPCKSCTKCGLWEKELDDEVAVAAREKALKELAGEEPSLRGRNIGPPIKKQKESLDRTNPFGLLPHAMAPWHQMHAQPNNFQQFDAFLPFPMPNAVHGQPNAILALANPVRAQPNAIHAQAYRLPNLIGAELNAVPAPPNAIPAHQPNAIPVNPMIQMNLENIRYMQERHVHPANLIARLQDGNVDRSAHPASLIARLHNGNVDRSAHPANLIARLQDGNVDGSAHPTGFQLAGHGNQLNVRRRRG